MNQWLESFHPDQYRQLTFAAVWLILLGITLLSETRKDEPKLFRRIFVMLLIASAGLYLLAPGR